MKPNNSHENWENLHREYKESIPDKIKAIDKIILDLKEQMTQESLLALNLHIHKLAGSAGVYGFSELGEICNQFHQDLIQKIEIFKTGGNQDKWTEGFEKYLSRLKQKAFLNEKK